MLTNCWKFPNRNVQTCGFVDHDKGPKSWSSMEDPVVLLERNLYGHLLLGLLWERQFDKILLKHGWEKFKIGNVSLYIVKRIILICVCGWLKIGWKETKPSSDVESTQPRSWFWRTNIFLGSCILGVHSTSMPSKVDNYRTMFESRISVGGVEKLPCTQHLRISSRSHDMAGHAKKCVERYCELANKTTQQLYKVSTPCIDDHHFKVG